MEDGVCNLSVSNAMMFRTGFKLHNDALCISKPSLIFVDLKTFTYAPTTNHNHGAVNNYAEGAITNNYAEGDTFN